MSRRHFLITMIVLGLLGAFALACCCPVAIPPINNTGTNTTTETDTATVKGTVVQVTNGVTQPVPNMNITLGEYATTTNDDGYFEIKVMKAGTYQLEVTGGDVGYHQTVTISAGETQDLGNIQLAATP